MIYSSPIGKVSFVTFIIIADDTTIVDKLDEIANKIGQIYQAEFGDGLLKVVSVGSVSNSQNTGTGYSGKTVSFSVSKSLSVASKVSTYKKLTTANFYLSQVSCSGGVSRTNATNSGPSSSGSAKIQSYDPSSGVVYVTLAGATSASASNSGWEYANASVTAYVACVYIG